MLLLALPATARESHYADALIAQAHQKKLAEHPQWLTLAHYLTGTFRSSLKGVIDSPGFYLAASGKDDPRAELETTIRAFFRPAPQDKKKRHAQCAFIARYHWLKAELAFDSAQLPEQPCPEFDKWYATIDPSQVTLVFPAAYLNQPSSMFGHTFLRIDRNGQDDRSRLHSYAINYGAVTGNDGGVMFAFKGLTGGYPGTFSIMPYYKKVEEYSDLENRDIWEYQLNLTPAEIRRLLMHAWELGPEYADYYFFDENCSYQLLTLLEAARPSLRLTDEFDYWAIPADTVRTVVKQSGLLKKAVFRPSARTEIDHRLNALSADQRDLVLRMAQGLSAPDNSALESLPPARQASILEVAYEYLRFRYRDGAEGRDATARRSLALLRARSKIAAEADTPPVPTPEKRPDEGHGSARISFGGGVMDGRGFLEMRLRPAYHDLLDPQDGFVKGSAIDFLDFRVRYFVDRETPNLESVTVLRIQSLTPRDDFFKSFSWRLDIGVERFRRSGPGEGNLAGYGGGGGGLSYKIWSDAILWAFADAKLTGTTELPDRVVGDLGPSAGLLYYPTSWWSMQLQGRYLFALNGPTEDYLDAGLEQSFSFTRWLALRTNAAVKGDAKDPFLELSAGLHVYF
jgi:hypothetical protein